MMVVGNRTARPLLADPNDFCPERSGGGRAGEIPNAISRVLVRSVSGRAGSTTKAKGCRWVSRALLEDGATRTMTSSGRQRKLEANCANRVVSGRYLEIKENKKLS